MPAKKADGHVQCMFPGNRHLPLADVLVCVDEMWTGAFSGPLKNTKFDQLATGWLV